MAKQPIADIKGFKEFRRDLAELDKAYRRALDKEIKLAVRPIVDDAKRRYRQLHPKRGKSKRSERGMKALVGGGRIRAEMQWTKYPYLLPQEFGTKKPNAKQFPPYKKEGYYFWPAIREGTTEMIARVQKALDDADDRHFSKGSPGIP